MNYERQIERETNSNIVAFQNWLKRESGKAGADTDAAKGLYSTMVRPAADAIQSQFDHYSDRSLKYQPDWFRAIADQQPELLAGLTVLSMLDATINLPYNKDWCDIHEDYEGISYLNIVKSGRKLGEAIEKHIFWADWIDATKAKDRRYTEEEVRRQATDWARSKVYERAHRKAGIEPRGWDETLQIKIGHALIEAVVAESENFEIGPNPDQAADWKRIKANKSPARCLMTTPQGTEELRRVMSEFADLQCRNIPMIAEPLAWTCSNDGGYAIQTQPDVFLGPTGLIKPHSDAFDAEPPTDVLDALNAAQAVSWRINETVLGAMLWHYRHRQLPDESGETVNFKTVTAPPKPADIDRRPEWKEARNEANNHNREALSKLRSTRTMLKLTCEANTHDAIWFAHKLDRRGRVYPVTAGLAPQGSKAEKALLEFAQGKPLGEHGAYWLAVELANNWAHDKLDKKPLDERAQWVLDNEDLVLRCVSHTNAPDSPWKQAENPFGFLRAAHEWAGYLIEGEDFVSHIPVNMDGSNSGIQHYAAMLHDPESAEKVNLLPTDEPHDIYQLVADETVRLMEQALTDGDYKGKDDEALKEDMMRVAFWAEHMKVKGRTLVKQPGMTFTYSATEFGMSGQIRKAAKGLGDPITERPSRPTTKTSNVAARFVNEAVRNIVHRPAAAMEFIRDACDALVRLNVRPEWTTPLGLRVIQNYLETTTKRPEVLWHGGKKKLALAQSTTKLRRLKHLSSVSPNFVHSLDSTHLMMVINRMADHGFDHLSIIHDSIGCHAADVDELNFAIRDEFRLLYAETDLLADLERQFCELAGVDSLGLDPAGREQGTFDVSDVMDSDLFFA